MIGVLFFQISICINVRFKDRKRLLNKKPINAFWLLKFSHNVKNKFEKLFTEIIYHKKLTPRITSRIALYES